MSEEKYIIQDNVDNTTLDGGNPETGFRVTTDDSEWSDADQKMQEEQYEVPAVMVIGGAK